MTRSRLTAAALAFALSALPAQAAPVRYMLGQYPIAGGKDEARFQTGFLRVGYYLQNRENAASARPDGSGTAYNLYQLFLHDAVSGSRGGFLADTFFLTDRQRPNNFSLSQWSYLLGLAFKDQNFRLQFDREESKPIDRRGFGYRYWDARAVFEFDRRGTSRPSAPFSNREASLPAEFAASLTAVYFLHNNSFPARADGTGLGTLRYGARGELSAAGLPWRIFAEWDLVTDKHRSLHPVNSEIELGVGARLETFDLALIQRTNKVLDGPGYHRYHALMLKYPFDTRK